jgi:hypothetical protein
MNVHKSQPFSPQALLFNEIVELRLIDHCGLRQLFEESQYFIPVLESSTGKFPENEWMAHDLAIHEQFAQV